MNSYEEAAERLSLSCFLNAYLREHAPIQPRLMPPQLQEHSGAQSAFHLTVVKHPEVASVWLPLQRYSAVGRHCYAAAPSAQDHQGNFVALDLLGLARILLPDAPEIFFKRLEESRGIIAEALQERESDLEESYDRELSFLEAEQLLIAGHSFHPTPKSRDEFTAADRELFSPELGGHFPLAWVLADPESVITRSAHHFQDDWLDELCRQDPDMRLQIRAGKVLLPLHPWQAERLKFHPALQTSIQRGAIRFLEPQGRIWYPTSSLRSLYSPDAPYMLKFSMSLKLTNSVRHLLVHEVERGLQVHDLLSSDYGMSLLKESGLRILREPAYAMLRGDNGEGLEESLVVCRENPFRDGGIPQPQVLATLTQADPYGGDNRIVRHIKASAAAREITGSEAARLWFQKFCRVALEPFLIAQADFGVLFGAHQQNMLLLIKDHEPDAVYYRDCQGTGYAAWAYPRLKAHVKLDPENGNILPAAMEAALFVYYLIINSGFNVIAAIADSGLVAEDALIDDLCLHLKSLLTGKRLDGQLIRDLLCKESLMYKGNFQCAVKGINENTSTDPMKIYTPLPNPLVLGRRSPLFIFEENDRIHARIGSYSVMEFHWSDGHLSITRDTEDSDRDALLLRIFEFIFGRERELQSLKFSQRTIFREEFFQTPGLWHSRDPGEGLPPERWTSTNGREHPQRPSLPAGVLYRRYLPALDQTLSFELFDLDQHLDTFHAWQNQPRVAKFWEMAEPRDKLEAYIRRMQDDPHQYPVMGFLNGRPIAYFEIYWTPEDRLGPYYDSDPFDRGFHFLIGDVMALGRRGTPDIIQSMVHFLFLDDPRTRRIMGEPRHDNVQLLRYLTTIPGWVKVKEFDFPHKRAALLQIKREDFFRGGSL